MHRKTLLVVALSLGALISAGHLLAGPAAPQDGTRGWLKNDGWFVPNLVAMPAAPRLAR